jgi:hypothetical protein
MIKFLVMLMLGNTCALRMNAYKLPDTTTLRANALVNAALKYETPHVPAALIVVLAWHESRFDPKAGPACGVMQVYPNDIDRPASDCAVWAKDFDAGVQAGVLEIETMLKDSRVRGDLRKALLYRACGNVAFTEGCSDKKVAWVNGILRHLHAMSNS